MELCVDMFDAVELTQEELVDVNGGVGAEAIVPGIGATLAAYSILIRILNVEWGEPLA